MDGEPRTAGSTLNLSFRPLVCSTVIITSMTRNKKARKLPDVVKEQRIVQKIGCADPGNRISSPNRTRERSRDWKSVNRDFALLSNSRFRGPSNRVSYQR